MSEMRKPDEVLRHHFQKAGQEGVWDPRMVEEFVGKNAGQILNFKSVLKGDQGYVEWMKNVSEFLPGMSEKFARGNAFAVGHIVGRDFMRLQEDALYTFAKEFTQNTMYLYGASDRARLITGPVGSLFGMFKNWQMHYMSQMLEYTGEGFLRGNWKPLLWQTGGTAAIGGAAGTPVWGIADAMSEWMTDKSAMEHLFEAWPAAGEDFTGVSDTVYLGLPALLGVSLQTSAASPGADPARDAGMLMSFVHWDRMKATGKAIGSAVEQFGATGNLPLDSDHVRQQFVRAFAPKTVLSWGAGHSGCNPAEPRYRLSTVQRSEGLGAAGVYVSRSTLAGFDLGYALQEKLWADQEARRTAVSAAGEAMAEAQEAGAWHEVHSIMERAMLQGLPMDSVGGER